MTHTRESLGLDRDTSLAELPAGDFFGKAPPPPPPRLVATSAGDEPRPRPAHRRAELQADALLPIAEQLTEENAVLETFDVSDGSRVFEKAWATAVARGALKGFEIVRMADGGAVASKYGMLRSLASLADVEAFLQQVGA